MDDVVVWLALVVAFVGHVALGWYGVVRDRAIYTGMPAATSAGVLVATAAGFYSGQTATTIIAGFCAFGVVFVPLWRLGRAMHGKVPGLGNFEPYQAPAAPRAATSAPAVTHTSGPPTYSGGGGDFGGGGASGDY